MPLFADEGLRIDSIDALELVLGLKNGMVSPSMPATKLHASTCALIRTLAVLITARQQG